MDSAMARRIGSKDSGERVHPKRQKCAMMHATRPRLPRRSCAMPSTPGHLPCATGGAAVQRLPAAHVSLPVRPPSATTAMFRGPPMHLSRRVSVAILAAMLVIMLLPAGAQAQSQAGGLPVVSDRVTVLEGIATNL